MALLDLGPGSVGPTGKGLTHNTPVRASILGAVHILRWLAWTPGVCPRRTIIKLVSPIQIIEEGTFMQALAHEWDLCQLFRDALLELHSRGVTVDFEVSKYDEAPSAAVLSCMRKFLTVRGNWESGRGPEDAERPPDIMWVEPSTE